MGNRNQVCQQQVRPRRGYLVAKSLAAILLGMTCLARCPVQAEDQPPATPPSGAAIAELIEKLGDDSYATRVRARNQLKRYGLEAFDALREAQDHSDSEILSAARYLISSLQVSWAKETDPKEVREILFEYGAQTDSERLGRIKLLGRLSDGMGMEALARVARFEPSVILSRQAALLVLKQPLAGEPQVMQQRAERITQVLKGNDRDSATWLLAYAGDLREGSFNERRWQKLVRKQRQVVDSGANQSVTADSVLELVRVLATRALAEGDRASALTLAQKHVDLVSSDSSDLADHCQWSIQRGLYPVVISLHQRNLHPFGRNPLLLYSAAHAYDEEGKQDEAQQLSKSAFALNPFPPPREPDEDGEPAPADRRALEIGDARRDIAAMLISRGRFAWAERELMAVINHCAIDTSCGINARSDLSSAYSERLRHQDVTKILFPIVDRCEKDAQYRDRFRAQLFPINRLIGLYHFELGLMAFDDGELEDAKRTLQKAYRIDESNIDILIKMYRIEDPDDPQWANLIRTQLMQNRNLLERKISQTEMLLKQAPQRAWGSDLAMEYNQYAWLVANTEGDYEKALRWSKRSVELTDDTFPENRAARLDTLARCYFALGRIQEAITTQQQALELTPHSPAMLRQLAEFESTQN